jgi:hypothetical protein
MVAAMFVVGGCQDGGIFSGGKRSPDEFAVYSRAPLSLPPDYALRPPAPGTTPSQNVMPRDEAKGALIGSDLNSPSSGRSSGDVSSYSPGTRNLLEQTGALEADPGIRDLVNRETTILAQEDQSFTERLMFWTTPVEYGTVVDSVGEAKRIHETQALGQPITAGETPTIERKKRAPLEGILQGLKGMF